MSLLPSRQSWIDVLRGTSVLMVILLHAHSAAFNPHVERDIDYTNQLARLIDMLNSAAAPFRMEMMFLLSGLFVSSGLKKGATQYLTGKISNILHPFILWSLIIFALKQLGSVLAKGMPIDWSPLVEIPLGYSSLTWFLYFLFAYYLIVPLLRGVNAILVGTSCILLAMALPEALQNLRDFFYYFFYFFLGDYLVRRDVALVGRAKPMVLVMSSVALLCTGYLGIYSEFGKTWVGFLPLVLASLPIIFHLAAWISRLRISRPLAYVGRHSIVFYLIHYPVFVVLNYYVLHRFTDDGPMIFAILLSLGIAIPATLSVARERGALGPFDLMFSLRYLLGARARALPASP